MSNQSTLNWQMLSDGKIRLLRALSEHPFLSRRQLELLLHAPSRTIRHYLCGLFAQGLMQRHNAREPWMHTRSLLSLTQKGLERVAEYEGMLSEEVALQRSLTPERIERLIVLMERCFQVRTFLLWLQQPSPGWEWSTVHWEVEIGKLFSVKDKGIVVPFHGGAVLTRSPERSRLPSEAAATESAPQEPPKDERQSKDVLNQARSKRERQSQEQPKDARQVTIVVEWDLGRVPVEKDRERLVRFVAAQNDPRFWGADNEESFPVWVIIAQDEFRLQDYYTVIRAAALSRQLPMPRAYLTTFAEVAEMRTNLTAPVWYSTNSGQRTSLLADVQGYEAPLPTQAPWRKLTSQTRGRNKSSAITLEALAAMAQRKQNAIVANGEIKSPAAITLLLKPREKRVLAEVADHPLLGIQEIAVMLRLTPWRVQEGLKGLERIGLVEGHALADKESDEKASDLPSGHTAKTSKQDTVRATERFMLTSKGMNYLAMSAGFENNLRRYIKARGWLAGLEVLKRNWQHTREENAVFLALAQVAQRRRHELVWLSELESRLYYSQSDDGRFRPRYRPRKRNRTVATSPDAKKERKKQHHSFLPDGRGTYVANGQRYEFALEIDRSGANRGKMRRKLIEYHACITSNILRGRGIELLRLLIVTESWERAETLRELIVALERELESEGIVPVYITTFSRLHASGADAPIWLKVAALEPGESALTTPKTYCFDCFVPTAPVPRKPGIVSHFG